MALLRVVVQDEGGQQIGEPCDIPHELMPGIHESHYCCLRFIDPYGDTTFNRLQIPIVVEELRRLKESSKASHERNMIELVESLAARCQAEPHLYLKFIGD